MSTIQKQAVFAHLESGLNVPSVIQRTSLESSFSPLAVTVAAVDETVDIGDILTPREIFIKLLSGDDLLVGLDGVDYPFRLSGAGDFIHLRLDVEGLVNTQTIDTVADVAGSLDGTYFVVEDVNGETWAIGFGTLGSAADHEIASDTVITGFTATQIADDLHVELTSNDAFLALFSVAYDSAELLTITDRHTGTRTAIADTGSTGFTLATPQAGVASTQVHIKSVGSSDVVTLAMPV